MEAQDWEMIMTIIIIGKDHGYNALGRYDLEYLLNLSILASIVFGLDDRNLLSQAYQKKYTSGSYNNQAPVWTLPFLPVCRQVVGSCINSMHHYIWGRLNFQSIADYIWKKNLSQKCGDLRLIEITT